MVDKRRSSYERKMHIHTRERTERRGSIPIS